MTNLKGLSTWERAEEMVRLAHPKFRDELLKEAEKLGIWRRTNRRALDA
jgi:acyl-CoA hydrolase